MKLLIFIALALCTLAGTCGGNCPSGGCPSCVCGTTTSPQSISYWCSKYSWNQACCQCIVSHESGGNADVMLYNKLDFSKLTNPTGLHDEHVSCDLLANLNCDIKVYEWDVHTWKFWSTHLAC